MGQLDGLASLSDQALAVKSSPDADEQPSTVEGMDNTLPPNEVLDTAVGLILNDIVSTVCLHSLQTDGKPESMPALSSDSVVNEAAEIVLKEAILSTVDIQPTTSSEESEKQIQDSMNTNNAAKPNTANCKNDSTFPEIILKPEDSFLSMYKVAGVKGVPKERYRLVIDCVSNIRNARFVYGRVPPSQTLFLGHAFNVLKENVFVHFM
ncbi:hypothetical protein BC833DRAFT_194292 [Globomyces pollinis-pini]|nr:hypothetical protein BC833DRAFT_194292 [Globomyces pollinis-pini]